MIINNMKYAYEECKMREEDPAPSVLATRKADGLVTETERGAGAQMDSWSMLSEGSQ